jgi:hypothetical protein
MELEQWETRVPYALTPTSSNTVTTYIIHLLVPYDSHNAEHAFLQSNIKRLDFIMETRCAFSETGFEFEIRHENFGFAGLI